MAGRRRPAVGSRPHMLALRGEAAALFRPAAGVLTKRPPRSLAWDASLLLREDVQDGAQAAVCRAEGQHAPIDALVNPVRVSVLDALSLVDHENSATGPVLEKP